MRLTILFILISLSTNTIGRIIHVVEDKDSIPKYVVKYFQDKGENKISDEQVLSQEEKLFELHNAGRLTNEAENFATIIWLNFRFNSPVREDLLVDFFPYYQKVTFYYFTADSVLHRQIVGVGVPMTDRKYLVHTLIVRLPANSLNNYFVKYEFNNHFKVAAFNLRTYREFFSTNFKVFAIYLTLFTCILLILILSVIFFFMNREARYLFYGLHTLFFGIFGAACLELFYLIPYLNSLSHLTFVYYVPFSISTIFFALYILSSINEVYSHKLQDVLKVVLALKFLTLFLSFFDNKIIEIWINQYLSRTDLVIYTLLLWMVSEKAFRKPTVINLWLTIGVFAMFIGQIVHLTYDGGESPIFGFMCFDILWFGIGLSINYRITKNEKVNALNELILIKDSYNRELEDKVAERTLQLEENIKVIHELNGILKSHNISLSKNVAHLEEVRILNKEISFEEFKYQFPDKETCLRLLVKIKWNGNFLCNVCGNTSYFQIRKTDPYLRKCTQCFKIHSAMTDTIFHNIKFPLEKAFYILFLCTFSKKYTIDSISEMISLRPATVLNFRKKVEEAMELKKFSKNKSMTWQDLIFTGSRPGNR